MNPSLELIGFPHIVARGGDVGIICGERQLRSLRDQPETLPCDGQEFDPAEYPELKAVLRDQFGINRVPDLHGRRVDGS